MLSSTLSQAAQDAGHLEARVSELATAAERVPTLEAELRLTTAQRDRAWARGEGFKATIAEQAAEIERLTKLLAVKQAAAKRSLQDLRVDPKRDPAKLPESAGKLLAELERRVRASEKEGAGRGITEVFFGANKESVWRTGHQYLGALELPGRILGTDLHVTESARLFDVIVPRLTERAFTRGGKTITVWEMGFNRLSKTPDNDKEDAGGWTTMRRVVSNMARNLKTHPENEGRVRLGKKLIRANEDKWLLIKGGDPDWRIPNERTLHTALARLGGFIRDLSMEDDSGIRKELEASIAKWTPLLADEFLPYDDHLTGEPCVTWCYNSLVATVKAGVTPGSDRHLTDTAHLGVYCLPVTASVFELGLEGLDYFSRADLQRRVGNGLWFALFADRPYKYRVFDEGAWHEGQGDMNMDISPRSMSCNDSDEYKVRAKKGEMKRRMKGYATGAPRILEHGDEWREGGNHRRAPYGVEAFPQGQAWLFAHEGYKKMSERELIGTPKDPIITTPMILSTFAGRAFAETYRAEGRADFR